MTLAWPGLAYSLIINSTGRLGSTLGSPQVEITFLLEMKGLPEINWSLGAPLLSPQGIR